MKQKVFTLLTLLVLCVTGAWGDPTTVFSFTVTSETGKSAKSIAATGGTVDMSVNTVETKNSQPYAAKLTANDQYIKCTLSAGTLSTGDVISLTIYQNSTSSPTADTYGVTVASSTDVSTFDGTVYVPTASGKSAYTGTMEVGSDLNGRSVFYVRRNTSSSVYCASITITHESAAAAPATPSFTPNGGSVDGTSTTTIASTNAQKIFYCWTSSATAPAQDAEATWTVASGESKVFAIPNVTASGMYLHAYGWNNFGGSSSSATSTSNAFNVTKKTTPAKTWDFTSTPADVLEALGNTSNWDYESGTQRYKNHSTVAADSELGTLTAASWNGIQVGGSISSGNLRINKDAYIQINGAGYYTITNLLDGDVVKVRCYSSNQTSDRSLTITGGDVTSASAPQSNNGFAETTIVKDGAGDLKLTNTGGGVNIMSIALNEDLPAAPTVAISTASGKTYATYVTSYALDFSTVSDDIKAYVAASDPAGGNITFTGKDAVPAGTPILVKTASAGATVNVPVASSAPGAVGTNKLVAGTGAAISYNAGESHFYYILTNGQFKPANNSVVAVGKAYLSLDAAASANELTISFDDEDGGVTGIQNLTPALSKGEGAVFDLQGRQVAQPAKGLYIVNGKKVVLK